MADAPAPARVLGPLDATCIVIGAIVGVGIFFTPARMAALTHSGSLLLLAWAIGGLIALAGALTFAELGGRYHTSGAQYQVLRDAYGPFPGFLFVFCNATAIQAGAAGIIAIVCAENLFAVAGDQEPPAANVMAVSIALILLVTIANLIGVRWGARIQNLTVFAKILTLLVVVGLAAFLGRRDVLGAIPTMPAERPLSATAAVMAALVPALFAYGGWQHALWISGEVRAPRRTLPRSILIGVLIVVAVYLAANAAYLALLGIGGVGSSKALAADAVAAVAPGWGGRVIGAAVAVSAFGVLNAQLLSGPRLLYGMAADGRFFPLFARLSTRCTPAPAILLIATMALLLLIAAGKDGLDSLLTGVVFIDTLFFVLTGGALILLRVRRAEAPVGDSTAPGAPAGFRVPVYPLPPLLFIAGEMAVLIGAYLDPRVRRAALIGLAWVAVGSVLYWARFRGARVAPR